MSAPFISRRSRRPARPRAPRRSRTRRAALLLALVSLAASAPTEYEVKAAFLFNFARYTEWPEGAFADAEAPLVFGVLGEDPFGELLDRTVEGKRLHERPIVVKRAARLADLGRVHVLYVSRSEQERLDEILADLARRPVFSVSDLPSFAQDGGIARFVRVNGKVQFGIEARRAEALGLRISSHLLKLAREA